MCDGGDRLLLTDHALVQTLLHVDEAGEFLLTDLGGGDAGPKLDDGGEVLRGQLRHRNAAQVIQFVLYLQLAALELRHALINLVVLLDLKQIVLFGLNGLQFLVQRRDLGGGGRVQIQTGACLVDQIDRLVRQIAVVDIALGQNRCLLADFVRNRDAVEGLVVAADAAQDGGSVRDGRLVDGDRLESALQRGVLFDILAVLGVGGRTDDLNLTARQRRLEYVGGIHRALGIAGADDVVHLVDDQNDVAELFDLVDQCLHAALKLSAELGSGDQRGEIEQMNLLVPQFVRDVALGDADCETLRHGGLADTRLTDQAGVVLLSAVEDLDDTFGLLVPSDNRIQLAQTGTRGQVGAECGQILALFALLLLFAFGLFVVGGLGAVAAQRNDVIGILLCGEHALDERQGVGAVEIRVVLVVFVSGIGVSGEVLAVLVLARRNERAEVCHLLGQLLHVLLRDAHLFHQAVERTHAEFAGAFETISLVGGLSFIQFCDKNDCHIFVAAAAKWHLHRFEYPFFPQLGEYSMKGSRGDYSAVPTDSKSDTPSFQPTSFPAMTD